MDPILSRLRPLGDEAYRAFQCRLIPDLDPDSILGVRTPALRQMAKGLTLEELGPLPHRFFEENQLHAFILSAGRDFEAVIGVLDLFLPHVNNWATCDQMSPRIFRRHRGELVPHIRRWLASDHVYTVRFGIKMLMDHYLDTDFRPEYLAWVAEIRWETYYVGMMQAWYFASALAKQPEAALPYVSQYRLRAWVHNKTIQKARESSRISGEMKIILNQYRIK